MRIQHISLSYRIAAVAVGVTLVSGAIRYITEYQEVPESFRCLLGISIFVTTLTGSGCAALLLVLAQKVQENKPYNTCRRISCWLLWLIPFGIPLGLLSFGLLASYKSQNDASNIKGARDRIPFVGRKR